MSTSEQNRTQPSEAELREAVHEIQRYFSDELAPMMVAESVNLVLRCPPEIAAHAIQGWVGAQVGGPKGNATVSDYLFHTIKKLHQMSEYDLVPTDVMVAFVESLVPHVLEICPEGDRQRLRENLSRLDQADTGPVSSVEYLHRQAGDVAAAAAQEAPAAGTSSPAAEVEMARGMRRFSLLLERLGSLAGASAPTAAPGSPTPAGAGESAGAVEERVELSTQALATAAVQARDAGEFQSLVGQMERAGVTAPMNQVFQHLSRSLPGWAMPLPEDGEEETALPPSQSARAMHRLMTMSEDPAEGVQRFAELMQAAIERFNEGQLPQATTMLELAHRVVAEQDLDPERTGEIRRRQQANLSDAKLIEFAEQPQRHELLRRVLVLFPGTSLNGLLEAIRIEESHERRRWATLLLEVHGAQARPALLAQLKRCLDGEGDDPEGRLRHSLVALLGRIPSEPESSVDAEVAMLARCTDPRLPVRLVREAIWVLASHKQTRVEQLLIKRLVEFETMGVESTDGAPKPEVLHGLLDRTAAALARQGGVAALRTIANHALRRAEGAGDTTARLEDLAGHDLSGDPELVRHLVSTLRSELPSKMLGLVVGKSSDLPLHLVRALSSTADAEVRGLLQEIVGKFAGQPFAEAAQAVLDGFERAEAVPGEATAAGDAAGASLTGDVELFGLPNLLQSLASSRLTGQLLLTDRQGKESGTITLIEGRLASCETRGLTGNTGFYQLFESPVPGNFAFKRGDHQAPADGPAPVEVEPELLEALRRYDEFHAARAVVPDDARYETTEVKPEPIEDEEVEFMRQVWSQASTGVTVTACEAALPVDVYRVRRLYAHWLETGALRLAPAPPAEPEQAPQAG